MIRVYCAPHQQLPRPHLKCGERISDPPQKKGALDLVAANQNGWHESLALLSLVQPSSILSYFSRSSCEQSLFKKFYPVAGSPTCYPIFAPY